MTKRELQRRLANLLQIDLSFILVEREAHGISGETGFRVTLRESSFPLEFTRACGLSSLTNSVFFSSEDWMVILNTAERTSNNPAMEINQSALEAQQAMAERLNQPIRTYESLREMTSPQREDLLDLISDVEPSDNPTITHHEPSPTSRRMSGLNSYISSGVAFDPLVDVNWDLGVTVRPQRIPPFHTLEYTGSLSNPRARIGRPRVWGRCGNCSKREKIIDLIPVSMNESVCSDCIVNKYIECFKCGAYHRKTNSILANAKNYCPNCFRNIGFHCKGCQVNFLNRDFIAVADVCYCATCTSRLLTRCPLCSGFDENDNFTHCDTCNRVYCRFCADSHDNMCLYREINTVKFLDGNPEISMFKFNRYVSAEIEAEKGELRNLIKELQPEVGVTRDGSLHDRGVELQTPPATFDSLERIIHDCTNVLKNHGYRGTVNCGLHLHFDARDIMNDHAKIIQVIKTFYAVEDLIYSMLPPSRWGTQYCQQLNKNYLYDNFKKKMKKNDIEKAIYKATDMRSVNSRKSRKYDAVRYYGLNIHSIFFRGTIELRYHSGTVEENKIFNWIDISSRIIDYAINHYDEKRIEELFNLETGGKKWNLFVKTFDIPSNIRSYVEKRFNKFNPNFKIKFNQGKEKRHVERLELKKRRRKIAKFVDELMPVYYKKAKLQYDGEGYSNKTLRDIARENIINEARIKMPECFNLPEDGGFIKENELENIRGYVNMGRDLSRSNSGGQDEPEI